MLAVALAWSVARASAGRRSGGASGGAGSATPPGQARRVVGSVFADANGNGLREPSEPGVADALVSDQVGVVRTNAAGEFVLELDAASPGLIYVEGTAAYARPDRFLQTEQSSWYAEVDELPTTADGSRRWDVGLPPSGVSGSLRFAHMSDPHAHPDSIRRFVRALQTAANDGAAFAVVTGDLVSDALGVEESVAQGYFELYRKTLEQATIPVVSIPGNHDIFGIERDQSGVAQDHPLYGKRMYREHLGPGYYSARFGPVRIVAVDSAVYDDMWYRGGVDETQMRWFDAVLGAEPAGDAAHPVLKIPAMHIPLISVTDTLFGYSREGSTRTAVRVDDSYQFRHVVGNAGDVILALSRHGVLLVLGGHFHKEETMMLRVAGRPIRFNNGAAIVSPDRSAGIDFPSGFTLYEVADGEVAASQFVNLDG